MYRLQNGLLHKDGVAIFALGQSYYPSYHPQKVPVLEGGDRIGVMREDLRAMREAGFHIVRMAALGDVALEDGEVRVDFPLPDAFCQMCEEMDLAAMIRLQGYSMNLRGFDDGLMTDQDGQPMRFAWSWFLRNCLNHPGIIEDNERGTVASAAHFKRHPSVVSFQIYNEPAYPSEGFFDYHPASVARYRQWLAARGHAPQDPPTTRPAPGADPQPWVLWRLFCTERLNEFLCEMGDKAREGYALPENLTCHMSCPVCAGATVRGEDYFATAERMDILGITSYIVHRGPSYHAAGLQLAMSESAAATFGKHTWLIEYNARTSMPPQEWLRETYAAVGHGLKGILYYQWRADLPFEDGPEPEAFGMLYNDGRKAEHFDTGVAMNACVNRIGADIAAMEKQRAGVGILYSNHQNAYTDALDNGAAPSVHQCHERSILALRQLYAQLSEAGIPADFARACDLQANPLGIRTLLLPMCEGLSDAELDQIDAFALAGGRVFVYQTDLLAFVPYQRTPPFIAHGVVYEQYDLRTLLDMLSHRAPARVHGAACCDARLLRGDGRALCCLINYDPLERPVEGATLRLADAGYQSATAFAPDLPQAGVPLRIQGGEIALPTLTYGAFILLEGGNEK